MDDRRVRSVLLRFRTLPFWLANNVALSEAPLVRNLILWWAWTPPLNRCRWTWVSRHTPQTQLLACVPWLYRLALCVSAWFVVTFPLVFTLHNARLDPHPMDPPSAKIRSRKAELDLSHPRSQTSSPKSYTCTRKEVCVRANGKAKENEARGHNWNWGNLIPGQWPTLKRGVTGQGRMTFWLTEWSDWVQWTTTFMYPSYRISATYSRGDAAQVCKV